MFGLVIPGRLVDTNFQQVEQNKFLITIPNAETINHIVVFLTGIVPLPPDAAGCIFFSLPDPNAAPTWHYLGYLSNDKPSAIYKLTNITQNQSISNVERPNLNDATTINGLAFNYMQAPVNHVAQIGVSIEPLTQVQQMVPATETTASKASSLNEFINKTVSNLYNYCSSFGRPAHEILSNNALQLNGGLTTTTTNSAQYVPLNTIKDWYESYTRRLNNDQNFWKSLC